MTIIVCTRSEMVADSRVTEGELMETRDKLFRKNGAIIGVAGNFSSCMLFIEWYGSNSERPYMDDDFSALVLTASGKIFEFDCGLVPLEIKTPFAAIGSGKEMALGALYAGATPKKAVEIVCKNIISCGAPIRRMTHKKTSC